MKFRLISPALLALTLSAAVGHAQISGTAWGVPASTADNVPTAGNVPGPNATEWATFNASSIMFTGDPSGDYSLGGFLNSFGAASNIAYMNGGAPSSTLTNVLFEFTGAASFVSGETFNVYHDDGVQLYVDGVNYLSSPSATSPITTPYTYTGPTGTFDFDFIYANGPCCMADFQTNLVTSTTVVGGAPTPEPSALLLLGTAVAGVLGMRRKLHFRK